MHEGKSLQYTGVWFIALLLLPEKGTKTKGMGGGGVLPMMVYTWRFLPKGVPFLTLEVNGMVWILLVEVYRRLRKSVIWVCERAQKG